MFSCHISVAEHWLHKPEVSWVRFLATTSPPFCFPLFQSQISLVSEKFELHFCNPSSPSLGMSTGTLTCTLFCCSRMRLMAFSASCGKKKTIMQVALYVTSLPDLFRKPDLGTRLFIYAGSYRVRSFALAIYTIP